MKYEFLYANLVFLPANLYMMGMKNKHLNGFQFQEMKPRGFVFIPLKGFIKIVLFKKYVMEDIN